MLNFQQHQNKYKQTTSDKINCNINRNEIDVFLRIKMTKECFDDLSEIDKLVNIKRLNLCASIVFL